MLIAWLDAGVPTSILLYTAEEQRCLQVLKEHLEPHQKNRYIEIIYSGCLPGSVPRRM
jgi:hypothetical protein